MKRVIFPVTTLFVILITLFSGFFWWRGASAPVSENREKVSVVVPRGKSAGEIGQILFEAGVIRNPLAFKFYIQMTGNSGKLQAGQFLLSPNYNLPEVLDALTGPPAQIWVTVPEGLRREQVVDKVIEGLELTPPKSSDFRTAFLTASEGLEGFLFPDTYLFATDVPASSVVSKMNNTFDIKYQSVANSNSKFSKKDVAVLASIIERETITDEERPIVAGILIKRMENDWPLQADAAVQYGVANKVCGEGSKSCGDWWPILTIENLEMDSPYNTYKLMGLPPNPIANAGLSSIKAAINPQDSEYWYYIHDPEGNIHFAKTLEEHNSNVRKYLGK